MQRHPTERAPLYAILIGVCVSLAIMTWLAFGATVRFPFINFDDPQYVYEEPEINGGLTGHGILWAFRDFPSVNWYPLTLISHMLDCQFYGFNAPGHHFTSVLLHSVVVTLLFLVLWRMTERLWCSAIVAALFAVHPLRVESVAWISERKDVLSGLFFVLTLAAYTWYARKPGILRYFGVLAAFACGLLSKQMLVTVPLVLLLLDYWPLVRVEIKERRLSSRRTTQTGGLETAAPWLRPRSMPALVLEKIPILILSAALSIGAMIAQKAATGGTQGLSLGWRAGNALVSYLVYIRQLFWPAGLAIFYRHPENSLPVWQIITAAAILICVTIAAIIWRRTAPYCFVGWLWYLIMLVPVVGVLQINLQAHADRYTYLPQIGLLIALVWGASDLLAKWRYARPIVAASTAVVVVALTIATRTQAQYWRDSEALWNRAIQVTENNDVAHANLADLLLRRDRLDQAIFHAQESLRIRPDNSDAENNLALGLFRTGHAPEALVHWRKSLELNSDNMNAKSNLAWLLATSPDDSVRDGRSALELILAVMRRVSRPNPIILRTLAAAYAETGQFGEAIETAQTALDLAVGQQNSALAEDLQFNIANYRRSLPLRDPGVRPSGEP